MAGRGRIWAVLALALALGAGAWAVGSWRGRQAHLSVPAARGVAPAAPAAAGSAPATAPAAGATATAAAAVGPLPPIWSSSGYRNEVVVLMYHALEAKPIPGDDITPANLAAQLALFQKNGYHVISLAQMVAFVDGQGRVPPNALVLSFDNGYRSQYTQAFPLLRQYHDPATFFLIGSWLRAGGAPAGIQPLTVDEVRQMVASGLVTVATQGWDLHHAVAVAPGQTQAADIGRIYNPGTGTRESEAAYRARVLADLEHDQRVLGPLAGGPLTAFAYPFGDYDPQLIALLRQAGFRDLFTAKLGWANLQGQSPNTLYRLNVGSWTTTPAGALSAIRTVARDAAADPSWRPPSQQIETWR